jgi:hypothetical protein
MSCKSLLALPLVLVLFWTGSAFPAEPSAEAGPGPPTTHTLTIYNGCQVTQVNYVWQDGGWHTVYDASPRNCLRPSWHPNSSPRCCSPQQWRCPVP